MSATQVRQLYCVWRNKTDEVVAIDENADRCAELMGISRKAFYCYLSRAPKREHGMWTILRSKDIESEEETQ